MLKQITLKNLYNFKDEITIDFTIKKQLNVLSNLNISNISLIYGKNNIGKTNLIDIIKKVKDFILTETMTLENYKPSINKKSELEIIFKNDQKEFIYGFELLIKDSKNNLFDIIDEWFYVRNLNARKPTKIFKRADDLTNKTILKELAKDVRKIVFLDNPKQLAIHYLLKSKKVELVNEFLNELLSLNFATFFQSLESENKLEIYRMLHNLFNIKKHNVLLIDILNNVLSKLDLDIKKLEFQKLDDDFINFKENLLNILKESDENKKAKKFQELIPSNKDKFDLLLSGNLFYKNEAKKDGYYIKFLHKNDVYYDYDKLSSGTKQVLILLINFFYLIDKGGIVLFDEIEAGLHIDLLLGIFDIFKILIKELNSNIQIIATTHREDLLDIDFISDESKIFIGKNIDEDKIFIEYLSNYNLKTAFPSKVYKKGAFESSPKINVDFKFHQ